jgi:hypothetical protein
MLHNGLGKKKDDRGKNKKVKGNTIGRLEGEALRSKAMRYCEGVF